MTGVGISTITRITSGSGVTYRQIGSILRAGGEEVETSTAEERAMSEQLRGVG